VTYRMLWVGVVSSMLVVLVRFALTMRRERWKVIV
jgi:hypothetical protein